MNVGVPKETTPGERRVALVPELLSRLGSSGFDVAVERGAGTAASFPDAAFEEAGATIVSDAYADVDAIARVQKPSEDGLAKLPDGEGLIGFLQPLPEPDGIERLRLPR